jgi:molybdopterin converting factor small subunit
MKVTIEYAAQVKKAAGISFEEVYLIGNEGIPALLAKIAESHSDEFRTLLFDNNDQLRKTIIVCINYEQIDPHAKPQLNNKDLITILTPMSGG